MPRGRPKGSKNKSKITVLEFIDKHEKFHANAMAEIPYSEAHEPPDDNGIIINKDWKVVSDSYNFVLMHRRSKDHKLSKPDSPDSYETYYYSTLQGTLDAIVKKEIMGTGMKDLQTVIDKIEHVSQDIKTAVGRLSTMPHKG